MSLPDVLLPTALNTASSPADAIRDWYGAHVENLISSGLEILLIVVVAVALRFAARRLITRAVRHMVEAPPPALPDGSDRGLRFFEKNLLLTGQRRRQRAQTIGSVLRSLSTIVLFTVAAVLVLGELGVNLGPIIASAGIVGVAVGFGAQSLVKDFLSGVFMLAEDQYGVGDWVDLGEASGTVEEVGLRVTQVRDTGGAVWYVRNGEILRVGNHSQGWARAILDVPVAYDEDVDRVRDLLEQTARTLWEDDEWKDSVFEEPEVWGVQSLSRDAVVLRLVLKTAPLKQWGVERELRERIKDAFDSRGVRIPFPQQTVWMHTDERPPVPARTEDANGGRRASDAERPSDDA